jgi:uncharacterized damage-inducible protein DinB
MVRLEALLESWRSIRRDTTQAWLDMPAAQSAFQPTPDLMTYRDLAVHILNASHAITMMLLNGETNFAAPGFRERLRDHFLDLSTVDDAALAAQLDAVLEADLVKLAAASPEFYGQMMTRFDGAAVTRLEMLQYAKEHELTHRSQMFMYLRLQGVVPPTTRRRLAAK